MDPTLCNYCNQPLDLDGDDALGVTIERRLALIGDGLVGRANDVELSFCGQPHLAAWAAERRLPPVIVEDRSSSLWDALAFAGVLVVFASFVAGGVFGFVQFVGTIL